MSIYKEAVQHHLRMAMSAIRKETISKGPKQSICIVNGSEVYYRLTTSLTTLEKLMIDFMVKKGIFGEFYQAVTDKMDTYFTEFIRGLYPGLAFVAAKYLPEPEIGTLHVYYTLNMDLDVLIAEGKVALPMIPPG